jgi:hypothetical protein
MLEMLTASPHIMRDRRALSPVGLKVFGRIADRWKLTTTERLKLLGVSNPSTYHKWIKDPGHALLGRDTLERISHILGIFAALKILFPSQAAADAWVRKPNAAPLFAGKPALDRMLAGNVSDLYVVRQYLDAVRGG